MREYNPGLSPLASSTLISAPPFLTRTYTTSAFPCNETRCTNGLCGQGQPFDIPGEVRELVITRGVGIKFGLILGAVIFSGEAGHRVLGMIMMLGGAGRGDDLEGRAEVEKCVDSLSLTSLGEPRADMAHLVDA